METKRIIYYYQTFNGLGPLLSLKSQPCTHIHLASIHFGVEKDGKTPYIHLNNNHPNDPVFDNLWKDIKKAKSLDIQIILMIGGEGGGFQTLFSNFEVYYQLLQETLNNHPEITGIDLDIEERVSIKNIEILIQKIMLNNLHFTIAMAPVSSSLEFDGSSMAGFSYKDLYKSSVGHYIDYFNGQFYYGDYTLNGFERCVENGYPPSKIVMGMIANPSTLKNNLDTLEEVVKKYPDMGGAFIWEYYDGDKPPQKWAIKVNNILHSEKSFRFVKNTKEYIFSRDSYCCIL
jgi:hypothetical protein